MCSVYALGCLIGAFLLKFVQCFLRIEAAFGKWAYFGRLRSTEALRHLSGAETPGTLLQIYALNYLMLLSCSTEHPFLFINMGGEFLSFSIAISPGKEEEMMGRKFLLSAIYVPFALLSCNFLKQMGS